MSKDMGKRLPQLYSIKMKISYDLGLLHSESPWQRNAAIMFFLFIFVFLCTRSFLKKSFKGVCSCHKCLYSGKVWTNSLRAFSNILKRSFNNKKRWIHRTKNQVSVNLNMAETGDSVAETQRQKRVSVSGYIRFFMFLSLRLQRSRNTF